MTFARFAKWRLLRSCQKRQPTAYCNGWDGRTDGCDASGRRASGGWRGGRGGRGERVDERRPIVCVRGCTSRRNRCLRPLLTRIHAGRLPCESAARDLRPRSRGENRARGGRKEGRRGRQGATSAPDAYVKRSRPERRLTLVGLTLSHSRGLDSVCLSLSALYLVHRRGQGCAPRQGVASAGAQMSTTSLLALRVSHHTASTAPDLSLSLSVHDGSCESGALSTRRAPQLQARSLTKMKDEDWRITARRGWVRIPAGLQSWRPRCFLPTRLTCGTTRVCSLD